MTQLSDLLARVEAAEGANRELDALICVALDQRPEWLQRAAGELWFAGMEGRWAQVRYRAEGMKRSTGNPSLSEAEIAPCTSSLDAALALVDRTMKPGLLDIEGSWDPPSPEVWPAWSVRWYPAGTDRDGKSWHAQVGSGRTPALALLAALLKALIASTASPAERQPQPRDTL